MPELPEVETVRRQLAPAVEGEVVGRLEVLDSRWCAPASPGEVERAVAGRRIERLARRGKYLLWELAGDRHLVMHLRMTGNLLYLPGPKEAEPERHVRARLTLAGGARVLFVDARRFGTGLVFASRGERDAYLDARLGVEPLSPAFTAEALSELAAGRRAPAKAFLLAQDRVAGIGSIYADEALFRARVHPLRPAGALSKAQVAALRDGIVAALEAGIDARGASIDAFRNADGARGAFQDRFLVHRRAGEPCPR